MTDPAPHRGHPALPLLVAGQRDDALRILEHRGDAPHALALLRHHCDLYARWLLEDWKPPMTQPEGEAP